MDARKRLKNLLNDRGILMLAPEAAKTASNHRTERIYLLTEEEADRAYETIFSCTIESLVEQIYECCIGLEVIQSDEVSLENDTLILSYLKNDLSDRTRIDVSRLSDLP